MVQPAINSKKLWAKLIERGFIFSKNKYLEQLVSKIKQGKTAKDEFRKIFEVNSLLYAEARLEEIYQKDDASAENTARIAKLMTEILLKEIEKGKFDACDDQGNILLDEEGSPKIKNLGGALHWKMQKVFIDFSRKNIDPYLGYFDDDVPHEQKYIEYLGGLLNPQASEAEGKRIKENISKQKKSLKEMAISKQIILSLQDHAKDQIKDPFEDMIKSEESNLMQKVISCLKDLTNIQKAYIVFAAVGFARNVIADIFGVKPPSITSTIDRAGNQLLDCIKKSGIESFEAISGGK